MKAQGLAAARGATDFGEYFVYFSFFLMVSALVLTGLFFKLGVEQRTREIGTLRALGFNAGKIRKLFLLEGAVLACVGAAAGIGAALAYGPFVAALGERALVELSALVGYYATLALQLRIFRVDPQ